MKKLSLHYIIREPQKKIKKPPVLILLHGYGSNENDLFSFADDLQDEFLVISVRAPITLQEQSYAWYSLHFEGENKISDDEEAEKSLQKIALFIDEIKREFNTNEKKFFVLGFSQGAILGSALALNYPNKIQYILALSGYMNKALLEEKEEKNNTEFFISHGIEDAVIPINLSRKSFEILDKMNIKNEYKEYNSGHGINPNNFYDLKMWIEKRIKLDINL